MKVMSLSSGVKTRGVFGWVSIVWLASTVSVNVSQGVELQAFSKVSPRCGGNVNMRCEASSSQLDIKSFTWLAHNKIVCKYEDGQLRVGPRDLCENIPHNILTLKLINVTPRDQGTYLCKVHTLQGANSTNTVVTVQDCLGSSNFSIDKSGAKCWFHGVYPSGTVHWFQGGVNLTDSAKTQEDEDQHGLYNVSSAIVVQKGEPYNCSLWIPSVGRYRSSREFPRVGRSDGPGGLGNRVQLQWIPLMVGIVMLKLVI